MFKTELKTQLLLTDAPSVLQGVAPNVQKQVVGKQQAQFVYLLPKTTVLDLRKLLKKKFKRPH